MPQSSQPLAIPTPQIAPSARKIARDYGEAYFKNQGQHGQGTYRDEIPLGYHAVSNFDGNYAPNQRYQSA